MSEPAEQARHYKLACSSCGRLQDDDGLILDCSDGHGPALLRTEYTDCGFNPRHGRDGLFRYQGWLPVIRTQGDVGRPVVYRSKKLANALGLPNLWIAFSGYWPERGAALETATFKELEAYTVLGRLPERQVMLTLASSGNTGAAFAWACSRQHTPCLLIIPEKGLRRFRFRAPLGTWVKLAVIDGGDYQDAIDLAASVSCLPHFQAEGGVKNVARRDGLATVLLSAFEEMHRLPSHYFQAVGSGTGAIAVLEAARRLLAATGGSTLPKLMLCQNLPFTPIYDSWRMNSRPLHDGSAHKFRDAARRVDADELTNWTPPYEIRGGVYDSLTESRGDVLVADNAAVRMAMSMFLELEGIDVEPAAGVALACLRDAMAQARIDRESLVLLNITGGGRLRLARDYTLVPAQPQLRIAGKSLGQPEILNEVAALADAVLPRRKEAAAPAGARPGLAAGRRHVQLPQDSG
jgi:cysteate synthase